MAHTLIIVDDEELARRNVELALADHTNWQLAASCASAQAARNVLADKKVDLLLLDIRMPRISGLDLARELAQRSGDQHTPLVVFITAYDEHALAAFDVFAIDYLLKPFDDARFAQMLARVEQQLQLTEHAFNRAAVNHYLREKDAQARGEAEPLLDFFIVRSVGRTERVAVSDVRWVAAAGNYVELVTADRRILHRATLSQIERRLDPALFLRTHRTALVRRKEVLSLQVVGDGSYRVQLRGGDEVQVSERHVEDVRALFRET